MRRWCTTWNTAGLASTTTAPQGALRPSHSSLVWRQQVSSQFVITPYANMENKIAVTAWRRILFLDEFDETVIRGFIDAYRDRAPESVPGNMF